METHRPVLVSQTSPPTHMTPFGCPQPSTHAPAMQISLGGLHCGSLLHDPPLGMQALPMQERPEPQCAGSRHSTHCMLGMSQWRPPLHSSSVAHAGPRSMQTPVSVLQRWVAEHMLSSVQLVGGGVSTHFESMQLWPKSQF
jgi:hypothetical protein